ncbi:MAG TPA: mobilization protein, partial [Candidatus Methylomirabilis sp.]|nr:mobilization protein [Candidatus Methylomirabilis sp.]
MSWRERAGRLRGVPLVAVLRLSGAQPDRYDPHKWHTGRGVLSVTGTRFINWNCGQGGGGAIDLVIHLHQLGFGPALEWL